MLFVAGDFNARIRPEEALYNFSLETNRNGQQLSDFMDQFNLKSLAHDAEMTEKYAVAVHNRYEVLMNQTSEASWDHKYENLITANKEIALNILPKKRKRKNNKACSKDITKAGEELEISAKLNHQTPTTKSLEKLQAAKEYLENIYQKEMEEYLESKTKDIEKLHIGRRHAYAWETIQ